MLIDAYYLAQLHLVTYLNVICCLSRREGSKPLFISCSVHILIVYSCAYMASSFILFYVSCIRSDKFI